MCIKLFNPRDGKMRSPHIGAAQYYIFLYLLGQPLVSSDHADQSRQPGQFDQYWSSWSGFFVSGQVTFT
jgi:hypothetical protein